MDRCSIYRHGTIWWKDIEDGIDSPKVIIVGILVKEDNKCYYIAKEMWETNQFKYLHIVPKKYVDKLNVIGTTPFKPKANWWKIMKDVEFVREVFLEIVLCVKN